jgi:hypothetical protein
MEYTVKVENVVGGYKIELVDSKEAKDNFGALPAYAAQSHQIPQRVKNLFEVLYPKPVKKPEVVA